jgi:hypothetical protein
MGKKQVKRAFREELARVRLEIRRAQSALDELATNPPNGLPLPREILIDREQRAFKIASAHRQEILKEFSDFILHRKVPERFKDLDTTMSD